MDANNNIDNIRKSSIKVYTRLTSQISQAMHQNLGEFLECTIMNIVWRPRHANIKFHRTTL
jgi:hypothetical protein